MKRQRIIGNWKMNGLRASLDEVAKLQAALISSPSQAEIVLCPPFTLLSPVFDLIKNTPTKLGAQDCYTEAEGAYTGFISAEMIRDIGADYVILGHSERRALCQETDSQIGLKLKAARDAHLTPILCVGETREEWSEGLTLATVETQLRGALSNASGFKDLVIAYEPVWAIGSGETPTMEAISSVHKHVFRVVESLAIKGLHEFSIVYGGSVKPDNAKDILSMPHVDGALVGGASLKAESFLKIIQSVA